MDMALYTIYRGTPAPRQGPNSRQHVLTIGLRASEPAHQHVLTNELNDSEPVWLNLVTRIAFKSLR
jgi:hypothetical protein